ncbi:MAG: 50S ribosomal protein L18 [Candidatus Shikimatogenerans sp. Tcar]|uniref:50S ribosomal protein L18 n=1 Tax=Candidatus Shikimatogenerans sp. Tcar TaxID=3158565 RepID=A0AAU7QS62_9FLAO
MNKFELSIHKSNKHLYIQIINILKNTTIMFFTTNKKKYKLLSNNKKKKKILKKIVIYLKNKKIKLYVNYKKIKYKGFNKILINKLKFYKLI